MVRQLKFTGLRSVRRAYTPLYMRGLVLIFAFLARQATATDAETVIRDTFIEPWVDSIRTNRPVPLQLLHPKVQACLNNRTSEYFESATNNNLSGTTASYRITKLVPWHGPGRCWGFRLTDFLTRCSPLTNCIYDSTQQPRAR